MSDFYIKVSPTFDKLAASYRKAGYDIAQTIRNMIEEFAFLTERYGKQLTPVKTGALRGSISVSFPIASKGFTARIGTWNIPYAVYVHEGTRWVKGRPFLIKGAEFAQNKFTDRTIASRIEKVIREDFITGGGSINAWEFRNR